MEIFTINNNQDIKQMCKDYGFKIKDFDESMQSVAKVKAISIGAKKELETKKAFVKIMEVKL